MKEIVVEPSIALLESMRSVGYSMEAAVADIIDNSIDAGAARVEIEVDVVGAEYLAILDNGRGMSKPEAVEAFRLAGTASKDPESRQLGRFGLGLKTASLSQARCVTVLSKVGEEVIALQWDIDRVQDSGKWTVGVPKLSEIHPFPLKDAFHANTSGTLVIWTKLDLLIGDAPDPPQFLQERVPPLMNHLSLTFHRFLDSRQRPLEFILNGVSLKSFDPFLLGNNKTQVSPTETIDVGGHPVSFTAYTLPHPSGMTAAEKSRSDIQGDMRDFQGFYLYRNGRLLSRGRWFGLAAMAEITKQTRVMVDVPRELDDLWQIDIKKSRAEPPASFKAHLKKMIDLLVSKGKRIHRYRGRKKDSDGVVHLWNKVRDRDGFRYEVNLENPLIEATLGALPTVQSEMLHSVFQALAQEFPLLDAYQELAGNETPQPGETDKVAMKARLQTIFETGILGTNAQTAKLALRTTEPFTEFVGLEKLIDDVWGCGDGAQ